MTKKLIVFVGPSAVGKTFAANEIIREYPDSFEQPKLYTTRSKRRNEILSDRLSISEKDFLKLERDNKFLVLGEFADNKYGYPEEILTPTNKHILINTWPALIPQFAELDNCIIIGMQAPDNYKALLTQRMRDRGDDLVTINKRLKMISKDIKDLNKYRELVLNNGQLFKINTDETIYDEVLPWIKSKLFNT